MIWMAVALAAIDPAHAGSLTTRDGGDPCGRSGCIDDLVLVTYDDYVLALDTMIDGLVPQDDPIPQLDIGDSVVAFAGGGPLADVWTEQVGPGQFVEHWFVETWAALDQPGASFVLTHEGPKDWAVMMTELQADPDYLAEPYVEMQVSYALLPDAVDAALAFQSPDVERWTFHLLQDDAVVGKMLREWHHAASGDVVRRVDHWVFWDTFELLTDAGAEVHVTLAPEQFGSTAAFYEDAAASDWHRLAVVEVDPEPVLGTCLLGGFGCGALLF